MSYLGGTLTRDGWSVEMDAVSPYPAEMTAGPEEGEEFEDDPDFGEDDDDEEYDEDEDDDGE